MTTTYHDTTPLDLQATLSSTGNLVTLDVEDLLSYGFQPSIIDVGILPPPTWNLRRVVWSDGSNGELPVPPPGSTTTHSFTYTISKPGQSKTGGGVVKLKQSPPT